MIGFWNALEKARGGSLAQLGNVQKKKKKLTAQLSLTQTYCEQHKPGYELHLVHEDEDLTELEVQKWDLIYIYIYIYAYGGGRETRGEHSCNCGRGELHLHLQIDIGAVKTNSPFNHLPGTLSLLFPWTLLIL